MENSETLGEGVSLHLILGVAQWELPNWLRQLRLETWKFHCIGIYHLCTLQVRHGQTCVILNSKLSVMYLDHRQIAIVIQMKNRFFGTNRDVELKKR